MWKLAEPELREFGIHGYVVIRDVIPPAILAEASRAIERLVDEQPPPEGHVGHHFYWLSTTDGGPLPALFYDTPLRSLAQSLVSPGEIEIAFNQLGHNIGGNYASERARQAVYFRLRRVGHQHRWRECLCNELLEYDPVRAALDRETA